MDGHYVPNLTFGINFCKAVYSYSKIPLDIHLMIENVDNYIPLFSKFKDAIVTIHPEVSYHPIRSIQLIKDCGAKAGIAIDPWLSLEQIKYLLADLNMVCIMTVNPGYSGQKIIPQTITKIKEFSDYFNSKSLEIDIEVDGNVSWENIPKIVTYGANILVVGSSSVFSKEESLDKNIKKLKSLITEL